MYISSPEILYKQIREHEIYNRVRGFSCPYKGYGRVLLSHNYTEFSGKNFGLGKIEDDQ